MISCISSSIVYLNLLLIVIIIPLQIYTSYYYIVINKQIYDVGISFFSCIIIILKIFEFICLMNICFDILKKQKKYCSFFLPMNNFHETTFINTGDSEENSCRYFCCNYCTIMLAASSMIFILIQIIFWFNQYSTFDSYGIFLLIINSISFGFEILSYIIIRRSYKNNCCRYSYT